MTKKYIIKLNDVNCIEIAKPNSSILVYKIPYNVLKNKTHDLMFSNRFIVYILYGVNEEGRDCVYVGKSKNGIDNRPTSHEHKFPNWTYCYVLTQFQERTFFNDGTIQYLEDKIRKKVDETGAYINKTEVTISNTANASDEEDCDDYLEEAYQMLYVIGLDLKREATSVCNCSNNEQKPVLSKKDNSLSSEIMPLFHKFEEFMCEKFPELEAVKKAYYVNYIKDKRIVGSLAWRKSCLYFVFNVKLGELQDEMNLLRDVTQIGHHGVGNLIYPSITGDNQFDTVAGFIKQIL